MSSNAPLCALCGRRPVDPACRPFCSERCRLLDLARWVDGEYRLPGDPLSPDALEPDDPQQS